MLSLTDYAGGLTWDFALLLRTNVTVIAAKRLLSILLQLCSYRLLLFLSITEVEKVVSVGVGSGEDKIEGASMQMSSCFPLPLTEKVNCPSLICTIELTAPSALIFHCRFPAPSNLSRLPFCLKVYFPPILEHIRRHLSE